MVEKSFATCYDRDCEDYAQFLMDLISQDELICNIKTSREEFKKNRAIVSNEYVLNIGEKSSALQRENFRDKYDSYGIHIGFIGKKAWISCENFKWDDNERKKFLDELKALYNEVDMRTENIEVEAKNYLKNVKNTQKNGTNSQKGNATGNVLFDINDTLMTVMAVTIAQLNPINKVRLFVHKWFRDIIKKSEWRKWQYKLAVLIFYYYYRHEFLELAKQQPEATNF